MVAKGVFTNVKIENKKKKKKKKKHCHVDSNILVEIHDP